METRVLAAVIDFESYLYINGRLLPLQCLLLGAQENMGCYTVIS